MTARQFPTTLMRNIMWSEQLCICEFFKTWTPVGFHNHVLMTLRRYIWRLVRLRMSIFHPNVRLTILYNTVFGWTVLTYFKRNYEHLNGTHSSPKITGHAKTVGHPVVYLYEKCHILEQFPQKWGTNPPGVPYLMIFDLKSWYSQTPIYRAKPFPPNIPVNRVRLHT